MKLLLIDDEAMITDLVKTMITQRFPDWEVVVEATLSGAMSRLDERFDVILTDYNLPDGRGTIFIKALRREGFAGRIILMSGLDAEEAKVVGQNVGISTFLQKPFMPAELFAALA